ncbi:SpoIIAA family protein [Niabella ginsengisoli]|uniref:STAS/SEC14 domain-containing protein n=1 Tax=Niabella ginsengisoli TaxID=522298 RepID=A0ABS9SHN3_9BACT|nr:STAS/SEC14 domain-containing protein [Niabella ginsengisoli]MCH5597886.1 STAS/SEC14 domain-containing protein [Niabella ginsengisoli]
MIEKIENVPPNVIAFRAYGDVTAEDFKNTMIPLVDEHMKTNTGLNYVLHLNTDITRFSGGAWLQDTWLRLKHFTDCHRAAIISDSHTIQKFTDVFSKVMPGEFRFYPIAQEQQAIHWVSTKEETPRP